MSYKSCHGYSACKTTLADNVDSRSRQGSKVISRIARSNGTRFKAGALVSALASVLLGCNASDTSGATDGSGGAGSNGTSGQTSAGIDYDQCFSCADQECPSEADDCDSTSGCRELLDCIFGCSPNDGNCLSGCYEGVGSSSAEAAAAVAYFSCAVLECQSDCTASGGITSSDTTGSSATTGVPPATTGASNTTSSNTAASNTTSPSTTSNTTFPANTSSNTTSSTTASSTSTSAGPSTTGGVTEPVAGINWLTFEGNWADPGLGVNGALNISGPLYVFGDGCATMNWNPDTRCVSGTLCDPGADYVYWGMAVGFDFHYTGETGSPPNTKLPWNATSVGATGLAWLVSGSAPGLQVWVTNMDPVWGGQCTADDCSWAAPPDGTPSTLLNSQDMMYFQNMVKDNWGTVTTTYVFDPTNIMSLHFKLASVVSGAVSYNFCVEQVGIVL